MPIFQSDIEIPEKHHVQHMFGLVKQTRKSDEHLFTVNYKFELANIILGIASKRETNPVCQRTKSRYKSSRPTAYQFKIMEESAFCYLNVVLT